MITTLFHVDYSYCQPTSLLRQMSIFRWPQPRAAFGDEASVAAAQSHVERMRATRCREFIVHGAAANFRWLPAWQVPFLPQLWTPHPHLSVSSCAFWVEVYGGFCADRPASDALRDAGTIRGQQHCIIPIIRMSPTPSFTDWTWLIRTQICFFQ